MGEELASILHDGAAVLSAQAASWQKRSVEHRTWSPEDLVGDATNLMEHLTPLVERGIDLTIELLRPWAQALESRSR